MPKKTRLLVCKIFLVISQIAENIINTHMVFNLVIKQFFSSNDIEKQLLKRKDKSKWSSSPKSIPQTSNITNKI